MDTNQFTIKIYNTIEDNALKKAWIELQEETDAFPQMHYEWVAPWWKKNSKKKKLYIVLVYNINNKPLGIAPFCIHKEIGVKVLRSIPIHFGDFYSILSVSSEVTEFILWHLRKCKKWNAVHLFNVNDRSHMFESLLQNDFSFKPIVKILSPHFKGLSFEDFLKTLSKNSRDQFKKKSRRLEKKGKLNLILIDDWAGYLKYFSDTKRLYNMRWEGDTRPLLSDEYYEMRNESLKPLFEKGCAELHLLKFNQEIIAFRLGFIHGKVFFDWKTAHNPEFNHYSPGFLSVGLIIQNLIERDFEAFNFMTGNYQYKRSWTNNEELNFNNEFVYTNNNNILGKFFLIFRLKWRDRLKRLAVKYKLK